MPVMKYHKIKEKRPEGHVQLINADGSWNIMCKTKASHILGAHDWASVDCKNCLKHNSAK